MNATAKRLLTYEDSLELPENKLEEIVNGEIRELPPPTNNHFFLIETLASALRAGLDANRVLVCISSFGLGVRREPVLTYRTPDLAVFLKAKLSPGQYVWSAPELVVECLSPSNRKGSVDLLLRDYSEAGAPEVWLINPEAKKIVRWNFEERFHDEVVSGEISPHRFPGLSVDLQQLWDAFMGKF